MKKTPHNQLQPIPVVRDEQNDIVTAVIAALDAHLALTKLLPYHGSFSLLPDEPQFADVKHAVLLWASTHGCKVRTRDDRFMSSITTIDVMYRDPIKPLVVLHVPEELADLDVPYEARRTWHPIDGGRR